MLKNNIGRLMQGMGTFANKMPCGRPGEGNLQYSCMIVSDQAINKSRKGFCKQNKLS